MPALSEVYSRAFVKLGEPAMASVDGNTEPGRTLLAVADSVRRAEIAKYPWTFATRRRSLVALAHAPEWGWARAFQLPAEYLAVVQVGECEDEDYEFEGEFILTDEPAPLRIRFTIDVPEPATWPALFVEVLACALASEVAVKLTERAGLKRVIDLDYDKAIVAARHSSAIQKAPRRYGQTEPWVEARG